jgi:hypothetical protein
VIEGKPDVTAASMSFRAAHIRATQRHDPKGERIIINILAETCRRLVFNHSLRLFGQRDLGRHCHSTGLV